MILEVIATQLTEAKIAEASGADRIELITGILEGGLTPSYGLIDGVVRAVQIPVHVMVRPRSDTFCYNENDLLTMQKDIRVIRQLGAAGIVTGALTVDGRIDTVSLRRLVAEAEGLNVTFHRAFDEVDDQVDAFQTLKRFPQINRVLTSGGQPNVLNAVDQIKRLVAMSEGTPLTILPGSGLKVESLSAFIAETGVREVHVGSGVRRDGPMSPLDPDKIQAIKKMNGQK